MIPGELDLDVYKGDSFSQPLLITDDDDAPESLEGLTGLAQIRDPEGTLVATIQVVVMDQLTREGEMELQMAPTVTDLLPYTLDDSIVLLWDLEMANADRSLVETYLKGKVNVDTDVSRP